jgi:hypothetical protein
MNNDLNIPDEFTVDDLTSKGDIVSTTIGNRIIQMDLIEVKPMEYNPMNLVLLMGKKQ